MRVERRRRGRGSGRTVRVPARRGGRGGRERSPEPPGCARGLLRSSRCPRLRDREERRGRSSRGTSWLRKKQKCTESCKKSRWLLEISRSVVRTQHVGLAHRSAAQRMSERSEMLSLLLVNDKY